ncbi:formin y 2 domain containing [Tyrophagus putrescentiae]|nr:formin y 2 domain containing [Tyrophagus putrescentiae]
MYQHHLCRHRLKAGTRLAIVSFTKWRLIGNAIQFLSASTVDCELNIRNHLQISYFSNAKLALDDCTLQLYKYDSKNNECDYGSYIDLEMTIDEQSEEFEGFTSRVDGEINHNGGRLVPMVRLSGGGGDDKRAVCRQGISNS